MLLLWLPPVHQHGITRALNIYDEGLILFGAQRVMWGSAVPGFLDCVQSGQYYALGGLFRLFGPTVFAARIWDTLFRAALALVC